ncbi:MAG: glycogen synthase, partial [Muribaculaceae bacterium]|nr:glycogen synthase [Muribaculaceae bacterium]
NGTLDPRFAEKLSTDGVEIADIAALAQPVDNGALVRLAVDFADAIIESAEGLNPEMVEYARQSGKPFLSFEQQQNDPEAVKEFYKNL